MSYCIKPRKSEWPASFSLTSVFFSSLYSRTQPFIEWCMPDPGLDVGVQPGTGQAAPIFRKLVLSQGDGTYTIAGIVW